MSYEEIMRGRSAWIALFVILLAFLLMMLNRAFPDSLGDQDSQIHLVYSLGLLILVGSSVFVGQRSSASAALKQAIAWLGIFVVVIALYSYRDEFGMLTDRVTGEVLPTRASTNGDGLVTLYKSRGGHFVVDGEVNDKSVRFLVDTGASDIAISEDVAERIGIDTRRLNFNRPYQTANGVTMGATVRLQKVSIGDITIYDVGASVMQNGGDVSLLGMSFLGRLDGYEVSGNRLTLKN